MTLFSLGWLGSICALAASALVAGMWQGLLLAAAVWLCLRMLPSLSAAARSLVWLAALLLIVLLHLVPLAGVSATSAAHRPALQLGLGWSLVLVTVWGVCTLVRAVQLLLAAVALRRISRSAQPVGTSPEIAALLFQTGRRVELCTSELVDRPVVAGFFAARILLPPELFTQLGQRELMQVLLHETEHLRRRDDWTNLLQKLLVVALPLNPALLWVERRLCAERELACDDRVLGVTGARKAYALCLAHLAEYGLVRRGFSLALGLFGSAVARPSELTRRVTRILALPQRALSPRTTVAAVSALLLGVAGASSELARSPQLIGFAAPARLTVASTAAAPANRARVIDVRADMPAASPTLASVFHPTRPGLHRSIHAQRARSPESQAQNQIQLRTVSEPLAREHVRHAPQQWVTLTSWHVDEQGQPAATRLTFSVPPAEAAGQSSRPSYAALPVQGGWLILKL